MRHLPLTLGVLVLLSAPHAPARADVGAPVPSDGQALEALQATQARSGGPPLSPADRAVMEQAARDLQSSMPEPGLKVGEPAPDFALPNAFGAEVRLTDLLTQGAVVLVFYRGAWCPYCNLHLHALQKTLPLIEAQGARLVAVTPQLPDKSRGQVEKDGYPFEILSDLDDRVIKTYRLYFQVPAALSTLYRERLGLDLTDYNGPGREGLPVPATYVIDRQGIVRGAFADTDYRKRMEPTAILDALASLPIL